MLREIDVAWAAGFIDGEGTITLASSTGNIIPLVMAYNTDIRALQFLKELFGGSITTIHVGNGEWKAYYSWRVGSKKSVEVIRHLLPYLRLKSDQAKIVIEFSKLKVISNGKPVPADNMAKRYSLRAQIKLLNGRGA